MTVAAVVPRPGVVAIVQARMSSTRLPGKVLADIHGRPLLAHVLDRLRVVKRIDRLVVATTDLATDDVLAAWCTSEGVECFRGNETDVLDRFYQAARHFGADVVVRITADCPLLDPRVVDAVLQRFLVGDADYVTNTLRCTYPDGLDTEVFSFAALERAWHDVRQPSFREHVTPYLRDPGRFRIVNVENDSDLSSGTHRWTVDEPADLEFVRAVYDHLGGGETPFGMQEILRLLSERPMLAKINGAIIRNEGYYKSLAADVPEPAGTLPLARSLALRARATKVIPSCTQTFSKGPTQYVQGAAPVFLARGQGSHVWDVDGNEFIDYPMGLGAVILGHNHPEVTEAVQRQAAEGTSFTLPHPLEVHVAEELVQIISCAEMVRFGKNGSDVTSAAIRLARAYTGRDMVACAGYHGWHDWYIGTTTRNRGVPKPVSALTVTFAYNDIASLERVFAEYPGQVAAVILEPVGVAQPVDDFLGRVQDLTRHVGAILIFDEVVSGFRVALGGAQEFYGVSPDLACFGKALANGYPLSALVGRREIMALLDEIFFSLTFGGEAVSLAAAAATLKVIRRDRVIPLLWEKGRKLQDGYTVVARELGLESLTRCLGLPPHTVVTFGEDAAKESLEMKSLFQQEALRRGVLFEGVQNICYAHSDRDIDETLRAFSGALQVLRSALETDTLTKRLMGDVVQPVFRRR